MTTKTPHPHAELIAEWIKDTSRIVQYKLLGEWYDAGTPGWGADVEFRFKPGKPPKPVIVSSLTDEFLKTIFYPQGDISEHTVTGLREVADAAAQRAIEDLQVPDLTYFDGIYAFGTDSVYLRLSVNAYLNDLKKGEL